MLEFSVASCSVLSEEKGVVTPAAKTHETASRAFEFGKSDHQPMPFRGFRMATSRPTDVSTPCATLVKLVLTRELNESSVGFKLSMALVVLGTLERRGLRKTHRRLSRGSILDDLKRRGSTGAVRL